MKSDEVAQNCAVPRLELELKVWSGTFGKCLVTEMLDLLWRLDMKKDTSFLMIVVRTE